jgi:hypothetical protein
MFYEIDIVKNVSNLLTQLSVHLSIGTPYYVIKRLGKYHLNSGITESLRERIKGS